ncbi:flagellar hook-length control protein FliK [Ferrimonas marina]|uniref:Hook-length control protein FliK n=1 Tax=Ferrimonas marina TaxID=299255 RepID=A0A1M5QUC6_9GAMM|nr:flagellar hook-length control protein FliK [Ferrimonas marina]SHH17486.1 hook-length control protein FliK [Ferrimonas marina]
MMIANLLAQPSSPEGFGGHRQSAEGAEGARGFGQVFQPPLSEEEMQALARLEQGAEEAEEGEAKPTAGRLAELQRLADPEQPVRGRGEAVVPATEAGALSRLAKAEQVREGRPVDGSQALTERLPTSMDARKLEAHPMMEERSARVERPLNLDRALMTTLPKAGQAPLTLPTSLTSAAPLDVAVAELAPNAANPANQASNARPTMQWAPVALPANNQHWARELMAPLSDHLRFQSFQQIKTAELRLDPPDLGKIELNVRMDGDRMQVQLNAANPSVREALQHNAERLREDLAQQHGGSIDVDVGEHSDQREQAEAQGQQVAAAMDVAQTPEQQEQPFAIDARV